VRLRVPPPSPPRACANSEQPHYLRRRRRRQPPHFLSWTPPPQILTPPLAQDAGAIQRVVDVCDAPLRALAADGAAVFAAGDDFSVFVVDLTVTTPPSVLKTQTFGAEVFRPRAGERGVAQLLVRDGVLYATSFGGKIKAQKRVPPPFI
jgi:hypothetical protein